MFNAVKGGNCTRECLEGVSLPTCPAAAAPDLAPAPAPGFDLYGAPAPVAAVSSNRLAQLSTLSASTAQVMKVLLPGLPDAIQSCKHSLTP